MITQLTCVPLGLYYKLHGVHRPTTMKKATIKRRKRVIPAGEDEDVDMSSQGGDVPTPKTKVEKGSVNADGSVNLGFRRSAAESAPVEPRATDDGHRQPSPMSVTSDLAAYHQQPLRPTSSSQYLHDDNRLPPITSLPTAGAGVDRRSSISPASFLSPARKRSFSSIEREARAPDEGGDNSKRLSSIKSILNPPSHNGGGRYDDRSDYLLPPLRSPATTAPSISSPAIYSRDATPATSEAYAESEQSKTERRAALQREAEQMREMLVAKERELLAMRE